MGKTFLIWFLISACIMGQNSPRSEKEIELFMITENIQTLQNVKGVYYTMESVAPFVWQNDEERYTFLLTNETKWMFSTLPIGVYSSNFDLLINKDDDLNYSWGVVVLILSVAVKN